MKERVHVHFPSEPFSQLLVQGLQGPCLPPSFDLPPC